MKFKQESYKPKNEELIKLLELKAGRNIILTNIEKKDDVISSSLVKDMKMNSPIELRNSKEIGIVKNIKMESGKIYLQTPDAVYELKIK